MAPKKKRKPVANPARGFATTSVPSKPKAVSLPEDDEQQEAPLASTAQQFSGSAQSAAANTPQKAGQPTGNVTITDMTPEQLEAHLEDAELENMVNKHLVRVTDAARRQVSRLESERRQLRSQAQKLSTYAWLPAETVDVIVDWGLQKDIDSSDSPASSVDDESATVDLWLLERVLTALNFPDTAAAITHVARLAVLGRLRHGIDSVAGLSEVLEWYAKQETSERWHYERVITPSARASGASSPVGLIPGKSECHFMKSLYPF
jgi:ATP-dependent RNA helicase DHX29